MSMFIFNTKDTLGKFDFKCDNGILLGCAKTSKAYRVYNSRTSILEEVIHLKFNDNKSDTEISKLDESITNLRLMMTLDPEYQQTSQ